MFCEDCISPANTEVDGNTAAIVFGMSSNSSIVVRVNDDVNVRKMQLVEEIHHKLQGYSLKPANIMARDFPIRNKRKHMPKFPNNNANTP
jgi:hypothetical protein